MLLLKTKSCLDPFKTKELVKGVVDPYAIGVKNKILTKQSTVLYELVQSTDSTAAAVQ